jgi:hypothetical protein
MFGFYKGQEKEEGGRKRGRERERERERERAREEREGGRKESALTPFNYPEDSKTNVKSGHKVYCFRLTGG